MGNPRVCMMERAVMCSGQSWGRTVPVIALARGVRMTHTPAMGAADTGCGGRGDSVALHDWQEWQIARLAAEFLRGERDCRDFEVTAWV